MNQIERVLDYLSDHGSITQLEANEFLGISKLATRVSELADAGVVLPRKMVAVKNRFGDKCKVMRYWRTDAMTCNSCGAIFYEPTKEKVRENMDGENGWEYFILNRCPECGDVL